MGIVITCPRCGAKAEKATGAVNRSRKRGAPVYCGKVCAGLARRSGKTVEQKKAEKAAYDKVYLQENRERIRKKKSDYFQKTYDPVKAAKKRKQMKEDNPEIEDRRRAYMSSEEYRGKKKRYDRIYRAKKTYGEEWGECLVAALDIRDECLSRMTDSEIRTQAGTNCKSQKRKRQYERLNSEKVEIGPLGNT